MSENQDDTIVCLMSMGFDIQDCQDAINFGKTNVEAAVEWIVAGKPGLGAAVSGTTETSGASLKLRPKNSGFEAGSSTPFQKPHPIPEGPAAAQAPPPTVSPGQSEKASASSDQSEASKSDSKTEVDQSEVKIISRMHMSDSQRKYKVRFEQKKIDDARKEAVIEKRKAKEEHARILKEIAEDREKKKLTTNTPSHTDVARPSTGAGAPASSQETQATGNQTATTSTSLLQIRFPDGRSLRQSFAAGSTLQDVWKFTSEKQRDMDTYMFIQPFPRREFTSTEMASTLSDLKLTPTGSLVLQKQQNTQSTDSPMVDASSDSVVTGSLMSVGSSVAPAAPPIPPAPPTHAPDIHHRWGHGMAMDAADPPSGEPVVDAAEEEDMEADDEDPDLIPGGFPAGRGFPRGGFADGMPNILGQRMPPPPGNVMGQANDIFGMAVGGPQAAGTFGGVGQRLVDMGDPQYQDSYHDRPARELALERAQARLALPQPAGALVGEVNPGPVPSAHMQQHVGSLLIQCLKLTTGRLNDPRHQLLSLAGISEDMAQVILEYLIKEKQLRPRTLNAFIPCYLRKLVVDCYPYVTNELLQSVRLHTNLNHVSVSACPLITDQGLQCLNSLKKLKRLNLSCCEQLTNKCLNILPSMSTLVWLNLEQTGVTDAGIIQYLQTCPTHLQHLILNRTAVTQAIFPYIYQCASQLKSLSLEGTKVVSLHGIQNCLDLEVLNLARTGIVTESLLCLSNHPNLVSLNIANTDNVHGDVALQNLTGLCLHTLILPSRHSTTNEGIKHISDLPLTSLDLTNYIYVGDDCMEHISRISTLKRLLLSNTKITDAGLLYLENLPHLEVLHLDRTLITDQGAGIIGALTNLQDLSMACTGVTTRFLLSEVCNNCTNLSKLNLSKTLVTNKGVLTLRLQFLQMLNLDGTKVTPDLCPALVTGCPNLNQMSTRNLEPYTRDDEIEEAEMQM